MIIDRRTLAGPASYFFDANNSANANLAGASGTVGPVAEGRMLRITGLQLSILADNLLDLMDPQQGTLLEVVINKELLPGVFADPYATRVHTIGGYEDFRRGAAVNCTAMEVEGVATLVSVGASPAQWTSPVFRLPKETNFTAAAWDLVPSRLATGQLFSYTITLAGWYLGQDPAGNSSETLPQIQKALDQPRFQPTVSFAQSIVAFQVAFSADVGADTYLRERLIASDAPAPLGPPLLRGISLIEAVDPVYRFRSLSELLMRTTRTQFLGPANVAPVRLTAYLDLAVTLTRGESITVSGGNALASLLVQIDAEELIRPPAAP